MTDLAVVDAHHHMWNVAANPYPWLSEAPRDSVETWLFAHYGHYEVAEYRRDVAPWRVGPSVHVQADWDPRHPVDETRWLQALHERHGTPAAIVGFAHLEDPGVRDVLAAHARHAAFRGVRQPLSWAPDPALRLAPRADLMHDRQWQRGFARLAALGLSFDLQLYPAQMSAGAALAAAHPETSIVLCHAGSPDEAGDDRALWRDGLRRLADQPNVTVKLSGITQPNRPVAQVQEYVGEVLAAFGPNRAMFGSNLPVEQIDGSVQVLVEAIEQALAGHDEADRRAVWSATAERIYRLC